MANKIETCLYIGKFQPFHKGHMRVIDLLRNSFRELIVGIGGVKDESMFALEERVRMLFENTGIKNPSFLMDLSPEDPNYWDWGRYVLGEIGNVDIVATGNDYVREDFLRKGIPILWLPRYDGIRSTIIRESIASGNLDWVKMVSKKTRAIIQDSAYYKRHNTKKYKL